MAQTRTQYAYPTGDRATSVILLERVGPAEVRVNENYAYTLILTNLTGTEIKDIVLTEEIGAGFAVSAIEPQPIDQSGNTATWRWEALAPRATAQIRINGATGATGEVTGCATITFRTGVCSSTRIVQPALALVKQTPPAVLQCDPIPVRLTVTNTGNGIATNVKVRDTLPGGWTTTDGRTDLVFDAGNLSAGQSRDFNVTVNASRTGSFTNNVTASEDGGLSAQASSTTMVRKPELAVTKSCPDYRFLGRPAEFDISVTNTGDGPARDTVLSDPLPAGTQFVSATDGGQMSGGRVSWSLGTLAPGDSRTVSVAVTLTTIGQIRNVAEARAYCAQAQGECTIEVRGIPAILLEVVDINDPVEVGGNETYVITVTNQGSAPGTNIVIECTLGDQQSLVSAGGVTNAQTSGQMVRFAPLPSLAPSAKAEFRVVVTANSAGDIRFKTSMTSDQTETPVAETESTHQYE
jgi:uncharacterized repeat protein (TIGR01451 family)